MKKTKEMTLADLDQKIEVTNRKKMKFGLQNRRMKALLVLFLLVISTVTASAQKSAVLDALSKHSIDAGILNADNIQRPGNYSFDFKQTTITAGKQKIIMAKYDPSSPKEEQWTVVSVDGKSPSRGDISSFRKNQSKEQVSPQMDESSYKMEKETPDYLVISYKQSPGSIAKDAAFMKDCRMYMTINLKTKKLEQVEALNEKPLKIKILTAEKFDLVVKYNWNNQAKRYLTVSEDVNMLAKFLGQSTSVQTISEYSNYTGK